MKLSPVFRSLALSLLATLLTGVPLAAQTTTYTTDVPFICSPASAHPITSFYQFQCRGMEWKDSGGNVLAEYFIYGQYNKVAVYATVPPVPFNDWGNSSLQLTEFTGSTYAFNWTTTDLNGGTHSGSASGTWADYVICGGRGCYWHAPKLLTQVLTINY